MFLKFLPALVTMLPVVFIMFFILLNDTLTNLIGKGSGINSYFIAAVIGTVSIIQDLTALRVRIIAKSCFKIQTD